MKHQKKLQRGLACVLSMLCLVFLCAGVASAAPGDENTGNEDIQLRFLKNSDGTDYTAQILTGNTIQVQMTLDEFSMPSSTQANQALLLRVDSGTQSDVNTVVSGGGARGVYTLTPTAQNDNMQEPVTYVATGNVNSITPPKNGYVGRVTSGGSAEPTGARLMTSRAISQLSTLTIRCKVGESPNHTEPEFEIVSATGAFAEYAGGEIGVVASASDLSGDINGHPHFVSVRGEKRITVMLSHPGAASGGGSGNGEGGETGAATQENTTDLRSLQLSFIQARRYDQIADENNSSNYLEENEDGQWVVWTKDPDDPDDKPPSIRNNYIRQGTTYTLTFEPPSSTNLYLRVATPKYVAEKEIQPDLTANNRTVTGGGSQTSSYPYLELEEGDTQQLIARDSMKLITKDERWNATFDIRWEWIPDEKQKEEGSEIDWEKAKIAVQIPSTQNSSKIGEVIATVNRQENDVTGELVARVWLNGKEFENATASFPLTIRGAGIPASIQPYSQVIGQANSADTAETLFDADARMPAQLRMDVFAGGIAEYQKAPTGPFEYVLQLNMGLKNAKSYYAIASLEGTDGEDVVELLTPAGGTFKPYAAGTQHIDNPSAYADFEDENGKPMQGTNQLMIRAKSAGRATLKIEYYIMLNGVYTVEENSTRTLQLIVDDTAPGQDATLSALTVEVDTTGNPVLPLDFAPSVTTYSAPVELPYAYLDYILRPTVNEPRAAERPVKVTATDITSAPIAVFKDSETGEATAATTVASGRALKFSLPETGKVVQFTFEVTAHDPRIKNTYTIFVRRTAPSDDDRLGAVGVYTQEDTQGASNLLTGFNPDQRDYMVTVPYFDQYVRVSATPNYSGAALAYEPELESLTRFGAKEYVDLERCTQEAEFGGEKLPYFQIHVTPESNLPLRDGDLKGPATGHYRIFIRRADANSDDRLSAIGVYAREDTEGKSNYVTDFNPDQRDYVITVPFTAQYLRVSAELNYSGAELAYAPGLENLTLLGAKEYLDLDRCTQTAELDGVELPYFQIDVTPESNLPRRGGDSKGPATGHYRIFIRRTEPSDDDRLSAIGVYAQEDTAGRSNFITGFDPDQRDYVVTVPYSTRYLRVSASPSFSRAELAYTPELERLTALGTKEYIDVNGCTQKAEFEGVELPYFQIDVTPEKSLPLRDGDERGPATGHYRVFINRMLPSENSLMGGMTVVDAEDTSASLKALTYTPNFDANNSGPYRMKDKNAVPYTVRMVRFKITPQDKLVSAIRIYNKEKTELLATITNPEDYSEPVSLKVRSPEMLYNEFVVEIVSEAGDGKTGRELDAAGRKNYYSEYSVEIERIEANTDADFLDVALKNQDGAPLNVFAFLRDETHYEIAVPFATRSVSFTAKTSDAWAAIALKDRENLIHSVGMNLDVVTSGVETKQYRLNDPGSPRTFDLIVTAQDGKTSKTYTFNIVREQPGTDTLLKKLTVEGLTEDGLTPIFKPNETAYSATVEQGAEGIRLTPTANDPNATIMVNGKEVESGQTTGLIELLDVNTKLDIIVTAEDGVTKKTYTIDLYNQNLVDKTDDADLSSLKVERGLMTPEFKPSVTTYEVVVKEDVYSVDIVPKPDDPLAEVKVLSGTRELGDYNGNYGLALSDGENQVTVRVTAPDKSQTKEYSITIYRNQEDVLKTLKPLTAEELDLENMEENPIIISISEYPRIESSVFNALKGYPEKTIIFQGLDYSITFQAANLNTVIPTREIYDFRLSFESPDAEAIEAYMGQWEANAELMDDLVMVYFDYHGDLPGPAMLNLRLGNKYGGQTLFWHYYNRERKKIEFYGALLSNSQGSISVPINHFSTYLVTRNSMIIGAENYSSMLSQISATTGGKQNPTTAANGAAGDGPGDGA